MTSITLTPPGTREVIDEEKAKTMIEGWRGKLIAHREANPGLQVLCDKIVLTDKSYTSTAASLIAEFLTSTDEFNPSIASGITVADLSDIIASRMEDEGLEVLTTISNAFLDSKLVEVDLSDNAMGSKGVIACETVLGGKPVIESLERLSLCNNGLSEYTMDEVAELLTKGGEDCIAKNLTKIHFFNNMSGNKGCVSFEKIMSSCTDKLSDIRFSGTRARAEGSAHIASALSSLAEDSKLQNINRLDLADNSFGDCFEDIATALKACSKLEYLNLHDCMLGDDGIEQVCDALLEAKAPLTFFDVSGNEITADGAKSVANVIKMINGTIVTFSAEENEMTSIGVKTLAKALKSTSLKELILNSNECGTIGGKAIIAMHKNTPNLEKIELNYNMFPESIVNDLTENFAEKLTEMEDNDDEEDADDDLDVDALEAETDEEGEEKVDAEVDDLAGALDKVTV